MTKAESTKAHATPEFVAGLEGMSEAARQSLATMSGAFSTWLQDASRMQGEAVRLLGERFHKDMELIGRLSQCKRPEDVLSLLAVGFVPVDRPAGLIELVFSGGGAIMLDVECIEARVADLGGAWAATSRPAHKV